MDSCVAIVLLLASFVPLVSTHGCNEVEYQVKNHCSPEGLPTVDCGSSSTLLFVSSAKLSVLRGTSTCPETDETQTCLLRDLEFNFKKKCQGLTTACSLAEEEVPSDAFSANLSVCRGQGFPGEYQFALYYTCEPLGPGSATIQEVDLCSDVSVTAEGQQVDLTVQAAAGDATQQCTGQVAIPTGSLVDLRLIQMDLTASDGSAVNISAACDQRFELRDGDTVIQTYCNPNDYHVIPCVDEDQDLGLVLVNDDPNVLVDAKVRFAASHVIEVTVAPTDIAVVPTTASEMAQTDQPNGPASGTKNKNRGSVSAAWITILAIIGVFVIVLLGCIIAACCQYYKNKKLLPPPRRSTKRDVEKDDIDGEPRYMPAPVISPSRASILKTQVTNVWSSEEKKSDLERNMPGWPDALNDIVRDTPVTHLAVYKLDHTGFARSADFTQVSKPELLFILKHMESPSTNTNLYLSVLVNNKEYMIDHTEVTKKALRASGPVQDGKDKEMETVGRAVRRLCSLWYCRLL